MRKIKSNKGITLVALIITIVVLMILAVVAISSIQNDGIIDKANTAVQMDTVAKEKEIIELAKLESRMDLTDNPYLTKIKKILEENDDEIEEITDGEDCIIVEFKKSENKYTISNTGDVYSGVEKTLKVGQLGTITYIEGMTWKEWCASMYNTYEVYISGERLVYRVNSQYYRLVRLVPNISFDIDCKEIINPSLNYTFMQNGFY